MRSSQLLAHEIGGSRITSFRQTHLAARFAKAHQRCQAIRYPDFLFGVGFAGAKKAASRIAPHQDYFACSRQERRQQHRQADAPDARQSDYLRSQLLRQRRTWTVE